MLPRLCRDHGRPGCLGEIDERYTMRFDEIGEPPIYWCAWCGPQAKEMAAAIKKAFADRPGFAADFKAAIEKHSGRKLPAQSEETR